MSLWTPWRRWRQRGLTWWLNRLPRSGSTQLTHRNVYILPTRAGWMLALTLLLLLVASINYQLNLGYLLTFLIAGCAVVGMHVAHNNLRGLRLHVQPGEPVFAGQPAGVRVHLDNPGHRYRYAVGLAWRPLDGSGMARTGDPVWVDVAPDQRESVHLQFATTRRGQSPVPALNVDTRFPMGTFRVWHLWRPDSTVCVYPAPELAPPPLPGLRPDDAGPLPTSASGAHADEMVGLRPYRRGDPLKWVAWKKVARSGPDAPNPWVSRDFHDPASGELWLDAAQCGLQEIEAQRSRLCAWVLQADALGLRYGLRVGAHALAPAHGHAHRQQCLEMLACLD